MSEEFEDRASLPAMEMGMDDDGAAAGWQSAGDISSRIDEQSGVEESGDRRRERELVSRICAGDSQAFESLYESCHEIIYRYILSRVRDRAEAEDLTQETFAQAYRSMFRFEGRSSLLTWLIGIARFTCLRFHRFSSRWMIGAQARSGELEHSVDDGFESQLDAIRMLERCEKWVAQECGEVNRSIFQLRYGNLKSTRFIASHVGKSEDAVKASLRRSRRAIARQAGELVDGTGLTADAIGLPE